jgi:hypothetical protein
MTYYNTRLAGTVDKTMTAEQAAKAVYAELCKIAADEGCKPDIEVFIRAPGEPRHFADETCWCVAYEAGEYQWAIGASGALCDALGKIVEPYYSFDLCFYPSED